MEMSKAWDNPPSSWINHDSLRKVLEAADQLWRRNDPAPPPPPPPPPSPPPPLCHGGMLGSPKVPGDCCSPTADPLSVLGACWGRGDSSPFHQREEGDRVEATCHGLYQDVKMSSLPNPETLVLVPCPALPPSLSSVPEPVALPRRQLREGSQDRTRDVSSLVSSVRRSLLQASTLALTKAWDALKIAACPSAAPPTPQPPSSSPERRCLCSVRRAARGGRDSGAGRRVPSVGLFPQSRPGAEGPSGSLSEKGTNSGAREKTLPVSVGGGFITSLTRE